MDRFATLLNRVWFDFYLINRLPIRYVSITKVVILLGTMSAKTGNEVAKREKISRRQMLQGAGIVSPVPTTYVGSDKGTIRGIVRYPWGIVEDARVRAEEKSVVTDKLGAYEITGLTLGKHIVTAEVPFPGYDASPKSVEVAAGETKTVDIDFDFKKTVVEGHVYDTEGKPIIGAVVSGVLRQGRDPATAVTDEKGFFRIDTASPGNSFIRINARGHVFETRDFVAEEGKSAALEFHLMPAKCRIHGIVTDRSGRPLMGEVFLSISKSGLIVAITSSDGETGYYEFSVMPGTYDVVATAPEHQSWAWRDFVSLDTKVDFKLVPLSELPLPTFDQSSSC